MEERSPGGKWSVETFPMLGKDVTHAHKSMMLALLVLLAACLFTPSAVQALTIYGYGNDLSVGLIQNVIFDYYSKTSTNTTVMYHSMAIKGIMCGFAGTFDGECTNQFRYQDTLTPRIDHERRDLNTVTPDDRKIDFAISDAPLNASNTIAAEVNDLESFPLFLFGIAPIFNIPGLSRLVLSRQTLARIFRGCDESANVDCLPDSITHWGHADILSTNPPSTHELLVNAGRIKVVVRADADASVLAFKRALCKFDSKFDEQVGVTDDAIWRGTLNFTSAVGDRGIQRAVYYTAGSIGFDRVHSNIQLGTAQVDLLFEDGTDKILVANTESVQAAGSEIAEDFVQGSADLNQLARDLLGVTGKRSWPIAMVSYISARTDVHSLTCLEEKRSLLHFVEYIYNNSGQASTLFVNGLAPLPAVGALAFLNKMRNSLHCNSQLAHVPLPLLRQVYFPADESFHHMLHVFAKDLEQRFPFNLRITPIETRQSIQEKFLCIANETCSQLTNYGLLVVADEELSEAIVADDVANDLYELVSLPFIAVSTGFIYNLCPQAAASTSTCEYQYSTPLVLDVPTAARILDLEIVWWNDTTIQQLNQDKVLPQERIVIISGSRTSSYHNTFVNRVRKSYLPAFTYAGGQGQTRGTFLEAWMDVSLTPFSFSFVVFNSTVVEGVSRISLINRVGFPVAASPQTIEACAMDTYNESAGYFVMSKSMEPDCYPLVNAYNVFLKNLLPRGFTAQIANEMFSLTHRTEQDKQTPIVVSELGTLTDLKLNNGIDMWERSIEVLESLVYVATRQSILRIQHNLNLIPQQAIVAIYVVLAFELAVIVVLATWVVRNRNRKLVRNSSPTFMLQVLFGAAVMACTVIPLSMQDGYLVPRGMTTAQLAAQQHTENLNASCVSQPILFSLGFFIAFSALFLKTWRLIRIFNNKRLRNLYLKDRELLAYQFVVVSIVVGLNLIWAGIDPLMWHRVPVFYNDKDLVISSIGLCVSTGGIVPVLPLLVVAILALALGNYFAYLARRIPTEFNESKWIAMTLVVTLEALVIGIPVLFLANDQPASGFIIKSLICLLISSAMVGLIFVPKVMIAYGWGVLEGESNPWRFANDNGSDSTSKKNKVIAVEHGSKLATPGVTLAASTFHNQLSKSFLSTGPRNNNNASPAPTSQNYVTPAVVNKSDMLSAILRDDPTRRKFRRYLQTLKMEENVRFWDAVLVVSAEKDEYRRYVGARAVIQTFCLPNAPFEVNLSSKTRQVLLDAFNNNDRVLLSDVDLFKSANKELFEDLKQSDAFRSYVENDTFSTAHLGGGL